MPTINKTKIKKPEVKGGYLENIHKPLYKLTHNQLREILDTNWYPRANMALTEQRKIWDYAYLSYKGIMLNEEINRKRRSNEFGMYVNVPRTYMTIEGIRRNFNISKLKVHLDPVPGMEDIKRNNISSFLNYDIRRGGTFEQIKDAGFYKLLYGNGFLFSYLLNRQKKFGKITGDINEETAKVQSVLDKKKTTKYFGMVSRAITPYRVFPDPAGTTQDYNDNMNRPVMYNCIREIKHIKTFRDDWRGIIPDKILNDVKAGGRDMTNYEAVKDAIDSLFNYGSLKYPGTVQDFLGPNISSKVTKVYNSEEFVEERIWVGEDFFIVQAGAGLKFCLISPNPNPKKLSNLVKLDDVKIPGEYWAMGEPYIMRYQQIEENRIHNAVLDTLHFNISGMMGINTQYLEDEYDTKIYPGKVWKLKAMPGVKIDEMIQAFQPNSSGIAPALAFMNEVKEVGQSTTSVTDFVTGASKSIANTATEVNRLAGASDLAIGEKIKEMAQGALTKIAKIYLSMYPVAYSGENFNLTFDNQKIRFIGETKDKISEKKLADIIAKGDLNAKQLIFADELDVNEPEFEIIGDITLNRQAKFNEWVAAIDFSNKINETAFATGDPRRIDTIKMAKRALENFDVVGNPEDFMIEGQPTKLDEIALSTANNNAGKAPGKNQGGAPKKNKITKPQSSGSRIRKEAQPSNRGKNQLSKKNL